MVKFVLRQNKFKVLEAENGSRALALATARKPDLIISDVMMDNVNGFMLCELLRKEPSTAKIPIILVTGAAQNAGAWNSDGTVDYLQKPVSMSDLLLAVRKRL